MQNHKKLNKELPSGNTHSVLETHDLHSATIEIWDNGIYYVHFLPESEVGIELARKAFQLLKEKHQNTPMYIMIEMGKYTVLTKEAREFAYSEEGLSLNRVSAIVVHSIAQRLMVNLMAELKSNHAIKVKAFKNHEEAEEWLLNQKNA
ncbi:MAG TPA: hypothetical protein VK177_06975 [Flavobacteriales bacterium]|nr:hypothetical protein [Flavobacteriales bacterium]